MKIKANKLIEKRKAAGLSQSQLAAASGVNIRIIQKCEQGINSINNIHLLHGLKLANALKCDIADLVEVDE